jgi:pimeloyl-ACP methyl ester carboxylesterase
MRNKPRADSNRSLLVLSCIFLLQACQGNPLSPRISSELSTSIKGENTVRLAAEYGAQIRTIQSNGIKLRIAEAGEGPLVILVHGWPESWFSWRYQLQALALAGYHAVAPDMRGYGGSTFPDEIEDYNILQLSADVAGIVDALNEESATLVGHDWGAPIVWQTALLYPDIINAVVGMSVPYQGRSQNRPSRALRQSPDDDFSYTAYFQKPGVAESEFDAAPRSFIARLFTSRSPGTPTLPPRVTDPRASAGGWLARLGEPERLPDWLSESELDYYANEFGRVGFRGGINYYRNSSRNWDLTSSLAGARIQQPALFIAGELDIVNRGATVEELRRVNQPNFVELHDVILIPGVGHRNQQQAPLETNKFLLDFLNSQYLVDDLPMKSTYFSSLSTG